MLNLNYTIMKNLILILIFSLFVPTLYSQDSLQTPTEQQFNKEMRKEKRKEERKAEEARAKKITKLMLDYHRFVLEANYISGRSGERFPVNSNLNFVMLDSTKAVLQLGSSNGLGSNGVGGITVDGTVSQYKVDTVKNKHGVSYTVTFYVSTDLGTYDLQLFVSQSGNADATVRGNTAGELNYSGYLVPLSLSRVYKGTSYP